MIRKISIWVVKSLLTIFAIWGISRIVSLKDLGIAFSHFDWRWVIPMIAMLFLEYILSSAKLSFMIMGTLEHYVDFFRINCIKSFANLVLPGGIGGEIARTHYMKSSMGSIGKAAGIVFAERFSGLCIQIMVAITVSMLFLKEMHLDGFMSPILGIFLAPLGPIIGAAFWCFGLLTIAKILESVRSQWIEKIIPGLHGHSTEIASVFREFAWWKGRTPGLFLFTILNQITVMLVVGFTVKCLGGPWLFWELSPIILLTSLVTFFSVTIASLGITEGAFGLGFHWVSTQASLGVGVSLFVRLAMLPYIGLGGYWFWVGWQIKKKQGRKVNTP